MSAFRWITLEQGSSATARAAPAPCQPDAEHFANVREPQWTVAGRPESLRLFPVATERSGDPAATPPVVVGPFGCLRHTLRAMASEPTARGDPANVSARIRPMVEAAQRELEEQLRRGAPHDAVAALHSRLVDHAIVGLFHLARFWAGIRTAVAPLTVVAVGAYGESLLPPGTAPEVVLLVPERGRERGEAERMAAQLVGALRSIGLAPVHSSRTSGECLVFARYQPQLLASLARSRHLAGAFGAWAQLRAGVDEMRWG